MDDALDAFDAVATELMLRHGMKASALLKRLRNITEAASEDLPLLKVLYCGSYGGGLDYSDAFIDFIVEKPAMPDTLATICALQNGVQCTSDFNDDDPTLDSGDDSLLMSHFRYSNLMSHSSEDYRISDVQQITQFGQHLMETWPGIAKLVKAYMRNDLKLRMDDVQRIGSNRRKLLEYQEGRDSIAAETGRSDGKTEWNKCNFHQAEDFSAYAPSALEAMCLAIDAEQNKLTVAIQGKRDGLLKHMTEVQYEAMLQSLDTKFPEEIEALKVEAAEDAKRPYESLYERRIRKELSFCDAVTKYGEHHYVVWHNQPYFDSSTMRFLLLHPEYTEGLTSEQDNEKCALQLGLCAASRRTCNLRIAEVPRLAEWKVDEYDGLESISLL